MRDLRKLGDYGGRVGVSAIVAWRDWQRGGLPLPGGLEDQPARWYSMVSYVDGVYNELEAKRREKEKRQAEMRGKRGH